MAAAEAALPRAGADARGADRLARLSLAERLALAPARERARVLRRLEREGLLEEFLLRWTIWARPGQRPPEGGWRVWLLMAGRGYGKTRAGAEWIHHLAEEPGRRLALVGPSEDEARRVMVEGASGLLACAAPDNAPTWEPSRGALTWPSGSRGFVYSAAAPESLRGPEHDFAWCDEIAKWPAAEAAWDNLMFGLRRGRYPRALATTTPRPTPLMRRLTARADVALTGGRTADNALLAESFVAHVTELYGGTRLGRQELDGALIEDIEGALWTRALIEKARSFDTASRLRSTPAQDERLSLRRVVIGVDPPASADGDACGIVVCGRSAPSPRSAPTARRPRSIPTIMRSTSTPPATAGCAFWRRARRRGCASIMSPGWRRRTTPTACPSRCGRGSRGWRPTSTSIATARQRRRRRRR